MMRPVPIASISIPDGRRPLDPDVVDQLKKSLDIVGLLNPITVTPGNILIAGWHRLEAARSLGWTKIEAQVRTYDELHAELAEIDENLIRAELHYTQRGEALSRAKEIYEALHPEAKPVQERGGPGRGKTSETVSSVSFAGDTEQRTGTSKRTVQQEVQIAHAFDPAERSILKDRDIPKRDALRLARQEAELRKAAVAKLAAGEASSAGDAIREVLRDEDADRVANVPALTGRYSCIVIDPPWDYSDVGDQDVAGRSAPKYSRMSIENIAKLPVQLHALDDAHLYLWTTNRMLPRSFELIEEWGFRYITMLTWCKPVIGLGNYFRSSTEHVLFGVRGRLPLLRADASTHFLAPRGKHSTKPDDFYALVESCSPAPRLEMFARREREGFVSWGSEVGDAA